MVVNFLSQVIFIFSLFLGTVIYANEFETKEKQKLTEIKKITATFPHVVYIDGNMIASLTEHV